MIEGFENETSPLSLEEANLIDGMCLALEKKKGASNAITNKGIREAYDKRGIKMSDVRVRKMINHIRINGLVRNLISSSKGYYIAESPDEVMDYLESLRSRINAIGDVHNALLDHMDLEEDFKKRAHHEQI